MKTLFALSSKSFHNPGNSGSTRSSSSWSESLNYCSCNENMKNLWSRTITTQYPKLKYPSFSSSRLVWPNGEKSSSSSEETGTSLLGKNPP